MVTTVCLNPSIDHMICVDGFEYGGLNRVQSSRYDAGGKGLNVAVTVSALGAEAECAGFMFKESARLFETRLLKSGTAYDFIWLDAGYDAKTQQAVSHRVHGAGIMGWKEMTEDLCTTCTSVLTEHVPQLAPIILRKALLNFSEIYGEELASTFESCLQES